jgi:hypothetical protein
MTLNAHRIVDRPARKAIVIKAVFLRLDVQAEGDKSRRRGRNDGRKLGAVNRIVERVALDGHAAGGADQALEFAPNRSAICAMLGVSMIQ